MPMLHTFTFKDTGYAVRYRKISPNTLAEWNRSWLQKHPSPQAPLNKISNPGFGNGKESHEANESDPEYLTALAEYNIQRQLASQRMMIRYGVVAELDGEAKAAVLAFRQNWLDESGDSYSGTDTEVYINHICIGTPDDLRELIEALTSRTQPTEDAISSAIATFPA